MNQAKRLRPELDIEIHWCEAVLQPMASRYKSAGWLEDHKPFTARQCRCYASIEIDGKKLCRKHAGMVALNLLLGDRI